MKLQLFANKTCLQAFVLIFEFSKNIMELNFSIYMLTIKILNYINFLYNYLLCMVIQWKNQYNFIICSDYVKKKVFFKM